MQSYSINSQKRKLQAVIVAFIIITMLSQWFMPLVARAESGRTLSFTVRDSVTAKGKKDTINMAYTTTTKFSGNGHFAVRTFASLNDDYLQIVGYIISDEPFSRIYYDEKVGESSTDDSRVTDAQLLTDGIYYSSLGGRTYGWSKKDESAVYSYSYPNVICAPLGFDGVELLKKYALSWDKKDNYKELVFDTDTAQFSSDIPTPRITVDNNYNLSFNNATDNYYFQIKGRWYSVDDIELYKQSAQWKYKYNSIIKSGLTEWTEKAIKTNTSDLNLATLGRSAFDNFLSQNPIDSRSYTGGTNALGNYFSGYNDALSTIKMLLKQPTTLYNGLEIYVRYYEFDSSGIARYGKWCHYYDNLANANGSSGSQWDDKDNMFMGNQSSNGLTDDQFNDVENTGNSTKADTDLVPDYNDSGSGSVIIGDADLTSITTTLKSLYSQGQEIINMFGQVFSFLPSWLTAFICTSIGLVCLIGIIKALRG